ncbi:MAG: TlpA family protein disulfide reductase, partial [Clostridiales bacterium]|nr:TlpA family protein disulfide reductase [Clostridiales bacterium]
IVLSVVLIFAAFMVVNAISNKEVAEDNSGVDFTGDKEIAADKVVEPGFQGDAYNFQLLDTDGNTHTLEQYSGRKVYMKFWATWCPSCLEGLDELGELHEQTKDREDIVILTVVAPGYSGEKSSEKFIEWYEEQGLEFTVLLDEGGKSFYEYGIRAVPSSFYIDEKGNLSETSLGHVGNEKVLKTLGSIH